MKISKIYLDLDGVLADFDRGVIELAGAKPLPQGHGDEQQEKEMWDAVRRVEHFYDKLEFAEGARELFDSIYSRYGYACEILTGIPKPGRNIKNAAEDKKKWAKRMLSPDIAVNTVLKEDKRLFCTGPDCLLIDDYEKNIEQWREAGGTGILHENAEDTMRQLKGLGVL